MNKIIEFLRSKKGLILTIITLSLPAIVEMGLNTMLGVADTIMLSRLIGKEALAAAGFANQIVFTLIFVFSSFNTGAVALVSRSFGEKNFQKLKDIATQNISLNLLIGLVIMALGFTFGEMMFGIFDVTPQVFNDTMSYFNVIMYGFLPMFLFFSYGAILRGAGDTLTPMIITAISNIINIIGNYLLITGVGPFPELGIAGAAWSTTLSRLIALILYIYVIYLKKSKMQLKPRLLFKKELIKPLWNISLPGALEQGLMQLSFLILSVIVAKLDTVAEATFRILIQIESISFMPAIGMSIAAATLVGKSIGEKDINRASEVGYISTGLGILWAIFTGIMFISLPSGILSLFSNEQVVILYGIPVMIFVGVNQIGNNFVIVISGALRGSGDTKVVMYITFARLWIIFVPLSYLFVQMLNTGIVGIWYAEIISFALFSMLLLKRFMSKKWYKVA